MTPHPFPPNHHERRIRSMIMAAHQRNEIWLNTAAIQYQYTINESQSKLPSTILLMPTPVITLPKRTKKYRTHHSSCGKKSDDELSHKQQKNSSSIAVGETRRTDCTIDLIMHTAQNQATENSAYSAAKRTSRADHTDCTTHTVQNHHRIKNSKNRRNKFN